MIKKILDLFIFVLLITSFAFAANAAGFQFNRNLYPGLRNDPDVIKMQDLLRKLGFFAYPSSTGNYFGATTDAVKKFQTASNIKPVNGYFGPLTRGQANKLTNILENIVTPPTNPVPPVDKNAPSTYLKNIKFSYAVQYTNILPKNEFIVITHTGATSTPFSVTGLKLVNSQKQEFVIPKAHNLPGMSAVAQDNIILRPYDTVRIITGRQDKLTNFRENLCVGYFDQTSDFNNVLSKNCPSPDVRAATSYLPDHCIKVFESTSRCRTVDPSKIQVAECVAYAEAHYNYQGCVNDNKDKKNFYGKNWFVWMQRPTRFMRDIHDTVTLYDQFGKVVDTYTY